MLRSVCHKRDYRSHSLTFFASRWGGPSSLALCPLDVLFSVLALWTFVMPTTECCGTVAETHLTTAAGRSGLRLRSSEIRGPATSPVGVASSQPSAISSRQVESSLTADPVIDTTLSRKYVHLVLSRWRSRADILPGFCLYETYALRWYTNRRVPGPSCHGRDAM